mmetsp:Transcript_17307/g.41714  ORF Transcript_17307/g.41714 Transcript_17307/m.41714 type:complete len:207 (+) Transcript_17307:953-1573(+)
MRDVPAHARGCGRGENLLGGSAGWRPGPNLAGGVPPVRSGRKPSQGAFRGDAGPGTAQEGRGLLALPRPWRASAGLGLPRRLPPPLGTRAGRRSPQVECSGEAVPLRHGRLRAAGQSRPPLPARRGGKRGGGPRGFWRGRGEMGGRHGGGCGHGRIPDLGWSPLPPRKVAPQTRRGWPPQGSSGRPGFHLRVQTADGVRGRAGAGS